jgi:hypothetical protein
MRAWHWWLIAETLLAYALPAYFWFWGALTVPLWILGASMGDRAATLNLASIIGGFLGAAGMIVMLKQIISNTPPSKSKFIFTTALAISGLLALWTIMTSHFVGELNWFVLVAAVVPTLCTVHLLTLCWRLRSHSCDIRREE